MVNVNKDSVSNPIKQRVLESFNESEENAKLKKEAAEKEYVNANLQYELCAYQRSSIASKLNYDPKNKQLLARYQNADSKLYSANTVWSCAKDKVNDASSYYSTISTFSFLANS